MFERAGTGYYLNSEMKLPVYFMVAFVGLMNLYILYQGLITWTGDMFVLLGFGLAAGYWLLHICKGIVVEGSFSNGHVRLANPLKTIEVPLDAIEEVVVYRTSRKRFAYKIIPDEAGRIRLKGSRVVYRIGRSGDADKEAGIRFLEALQAVRGSE